VQQLSRSCSYVKGKIVALLAHTAMGGMVRMAGDHMADQAITIMRRQGWMKSTLGCTPLSLQVCRSQPPHSASNPGKVGYGTYARLLFSFSKCAIHQFLAVPILIQHASSCLKPAGLLLTSMQGQRLSCSSLAHTPAEVER
jgi:hypothetical protein